MIVDVPGKGPVEFPDDTPHDQVEKAIKDWLGGEEKPPGALETAGREAALGVAPGAAAAAAFVPGMAAGAPFSEFAGPAAPAVPLITGGVASLLAGGAVEFGQQKLLEKYAPGFLQRTAAGAAAHPVAAGVGRVASALPSFELAPAAILRSPKALAAQLGAQLGITAAQTGVVEHRLPTAPELLESAAIAGLYGHPKFSLPIPKTLTTQLKDVYATQKRQREESRQQQYPGTEAQRVSPETGGGNRPAPATRLEEEAQVPLITGSDQTGWTLRMGGREETGFKTEGEAIAAAQGVMAGERELPTAVEPTPHQIALDELKSRGWDLKWPFVPADLENKSFRDAIQSDPTISAEEKSKILSFAPGGPNEIRVTIPPMRAEDEDFVARMEREAIDQGEQMGIKFEVKEKQPEPEDPNVPFAKGAYFQALGENRAALYRDKFKEWVTQDLRGLSESRIKNIIYSKVSQELEHNHVMRSATNDEISQYGRNLTPFERDIEERIYGKRFKDDYLNLGHEAFARRLQQAMGMTRGMFAEFALKENIQLRTLDLMARIVRRAREALGEKRAAANRELYDRVLDNIDYAKAVLTGTQFQGPAASRRERLEDASEYNYYKTRLVNPDLLKYAVRVGPHIAVPVGGERKSGSLGCAELYNKEDAESLADRLSGKRGFPNPHAQEIKRVKGDVNYTVAWGEPIDFERAFYDDPPVYHRRLGKQFGYKQSDSTPTEPLHPSVELELSKPPPQSEFPFASRRKTAAEIAAEERAREQGQAEMFGQVVKTPSQIPPTPPELRQVATTRPAGQLENAAAYIFSGFNPPIEARVPGEGPPIGEATEPTFQNFLKWARRNVSETIQPGPLFDVWLDTVSKSIERSPGAKLNEMVEKLELQHRVYPWKRLPGGTEYTRIEIPDFQQIPPDPTRLPMGIEAGIRERAMARKEDPDRAVERVRKAVMAEIPKETKDRLADERKRILSGQKLRSKALSAIYQKVIEEGMPTITDLTPKDITVDDIAFDNPNTIHGAYRTIRPDERANEAKLREIFTDEARRKGDPVSHTKRLAVMLNQRTGEVALVSAYPYGAGASKGIRVVEPSGATGKRGKPNVPIKSAMNRGWEPIISMLRNEPVKDFYKGFRDISEYNRYLGTEASQLESSSVQDLIGARPEDELSELPETGVGRGEGGDLIGPEADIARMGPGERWQETPLSTREALAIHNWLNDPEEWSGTSGISPTIESATTKPGMREALQRLADLGENNKLKPRQWNAIVALRKIAAEQYRRDRSEFAGLLNQLRGELRGATPEQRRRAIEDLQRNAPTPEASMVTALDRLYEYNEASESQAEYLSHVMGEFARPTPEPKGPATIQGAPTAEERIARGLQYSDRLGSPPTEAVPPAIGREGPAASIREVKERATKEWNDIAGYVKKFFTEPEVRRQAGEEVAYHGKKFTAVPFKRKPVEHDIMAGADGADRQVDLYSNRISNDSRIASVKPEERPKKPTLMQRLRGGVLFNPLAVQIREAGLAVQAAKHAAKDEEWQRVIRLWAEAHRTFDPIQEAARAAGKAVPPIPPEMRPEFKEPEWVEERHFDQAIMQAEKGIAAAEQKMKSPTVTERIIGRRWKKAAERLLRNAQWAKAHLNDPEVAKQLRDTWEVTEAGHKQNLDNMNAYGMHVSGRDYYVPGRFEGSIWAGEALTWGDMRILGRQFRLPKTFRSYYEAISSGPYIPVNYDIADLLQHSLAASGRIMARETWGEGMKGITDPVLNKPVAIEPQWTRVAQTKVDPNQLRQLDPEMQPIIDELNDQITKYDETTQKGKEARQRLKSFQRAISQGSTFTWEVPKGKQEYDLFYPTPRSKPIAVLAGYKQLVEAAIARSEIREHAFLGPVLTASQMLKHGLILIIDTFHPGRLGQYAGALAGKNLWGAEVPGFHKGLHALMYSPESLAEAVKIGAITQKSADWALAPLKIYDRGVIKTMTRQELLRLLLSRGLNATQTADTLYRNSIQRIPFIGEQWNQLLSPLNKWIFDRITPGVIAESAVGNVERINPKNKHLSLDAQVREVVRDMNVFYGNLGRNGIFKHPTARDLAQIVLLAPLWQEGLIGKEARTLSRLTGVSYALGRRGLGADVYLGPLVRGVVRGLGAYFVLTQMINLASRGKWTFQNEEADHKLDAWLPVGGEQGVWLSPMSVFGEVTHDLMRLGESKPKIWDGITQFGRNKLGPIGRLGWILAEGKSPTGEDITTTGGVLGRAAQELAPAPISVGTYAKAALPGVFGKNRPGLVQQRAISSIGIKTQLPTRAETDIRRLASAFVKAHNLAYEPLAFEPTDQESYAKLRGALRNDDEAGAAKILTGLRQHRTNDQILRAMRLESQRPFAGSGANETLFLYSLSNQQLEQYFKANMQRAELYQKFLAWYVRQPLK